MKRAAALLVVVVSAACIVPEAEELVEAKTPGNVCGGPADGVLESSSSALSSFRVSVSTDLNLGCIEVSITDMARSITRGVAMEGVPFEGGRSRCVAIFTDMNELNLIAKVRERSCQGRVAVIEYRSIRVPASSLSEVVIQLSALDDDGDGYVSASVGGSDCDDQNPFVHPGVSESCNNGVDDNCSGGQDEGC
jgi:hypothetical protein